MACPGRAAARTLGLTRPPTEPIIDDTHPAAPLRRADTARPHGNNSLTRPVTNPQRTRRRARRHFRAPQHPAGGRSSLQCVPRRALPSMSPAEHHQSKPRQRAAAPPRAAPAARAERPRRAQHGERRQQRAHAARGPPSASTESSRSGHSLGSRPRRRPPSLHCPPRESARPARWWSTCCDARERTNAPSAAATPPRAVPMCVHAGEGRLGARVEGCGELSTRRPRRSDHIGRTAAPAAPTAAALRAPRIACCSE